MKTGTFHHQSSWTWINKQGGPCGTHLYISDGPSYKKQTMCLFMELLV